MFSGSGTDLSIVIVFAALVRRWLCTVLRSQEGQMENMREINVSNPKYMCYCVPLGFHDFAHDGLRDIVTTLVRSKPCETNMSTLFL